MNLIFELTSVIVWVNNEECLEVGAMRPDYVDWDEPDDALGNVWHILR